jgi:riboflavin biosynthesis pyrimidine reductase
MSLTHGHLRSLADYIIIGSSTLLSDNPRLLPYHIDNGLVPVVLTGRVDEVKDWLNGPTCRMGRKCDCIVTGGTAWGVKKSLDGLKVGGGGAKVIVEGGPGTLQRWIDEGCWDVCVVTVGGKWWGGEGGRVRMKKGVEGEFFKVGKDVVWVAKNIGGKGRGGGGGGYCNEVIP